MDMSLVVRVLSFFSLPDGGPKSWRQGRTLPTQVVEMHSFDLLQLVNFIAEHYMWAGTKRTEGAGTEGRGRGGRLAALLGIDA